MFPFQQGDELVFQIPSATHPDHNNINISQQQNQQDHYHNNLIPMSADSTSPAVFTRSAPTTVRRRKATLTPVIASEIAHQFGDDTKNESERRKEVHREIEKQRRQEMSNLYSSLRSQLPVEYIKGKRSISDHMNEAVNYIKHLQNRNKKLSLKRDQLKRTSTSKLSNEAMNISSPPASSSFSNLCVRVSMCWGGVEIVITSGVADLNTPLPISKILRTLEADGFIVYGYVSTAVGESVICTIQAQVAGGHTLLDVPSLQEKLFNALF